MKSWRTTVLGILGAISILAGQIQAALDDDPTTVVDFTQVQLALGVLGLGIVSRDNKVSSENAGAK